VPIHLTMFVTHDAADRSVQHTAGNHQRVASTFVSRAGASIWEMKKRTISMAAAAKGSGMKGTRSRRTIDGN
jgi:hypothetical protein